MAISRGVNARSTVMPQRGSVARVGRGMIRLNTAQGHDRADAQLEVLSGSRRIDLLDMLVDPHDSAGTTDCPRSTSSVRLAVATCCSATRLLMAHDVAIVVVPSASG